jgi:hypothetical protein
MLESGVASGVATSGLTGSDALITGLVAAVVVVWPPVAASAATCSDYPNQAAAQRAADTLDPDGDGIYCESLPSPCSTAAGGAPPAATTPPAGRSCTRPRGVQTISLGATKYPSIPYSGPRPESEALPLRWWQIGERTINYRATKGGRVKPRHTKLLAPLGRDLAEFRIRCGRPAEDELVFGSWSGDDWDNWRERIFQPAAIAVGLPDDTIPRDLRGSFASLLIFEGLNVLEVAPQLGHKPSTCLDIYGRLFEEFDPYRRRPAVDVIREAREAIRNGAVPTGYPAAWGGGTGSGGATPEEAD